MLNPRLGDGPSAQVRFSVPQDAVVSGRPVHERTLELSDKLNGKTMATEQIAPFANHKALTMAVHTVSRSNPNIPVFDREEPGVRRRIPAGGP